MNEENECLKEKIANLRCYVEQLKELVERQGKMLEDLCEMICEDHLDAFERNTYRTDEEYYAAVKEGNE